MISSRNLTWFVGALFLLLPACGDEPGPTGTDGAAAQLAFATQPTDATAGDAIGPAVEVEVLDAAGNRDTGSSASITMALAADPTGGSATLSGTLTVDAAAGVAVFSDLGIDLPADGFTLEATAIGLPAVTSDPFGVHLTFVQTSGGVFHTCAMTAAGHAYCWGNNGEGQLGDGTNTDRSTPVAVDVSGLATQTFALVSAGAFHTCGVTTAEEPFCWGDNEDGRLGDGTTLNRSSPVAVDVSGLSTQRFARVSAGAFHTCGVTATDGLFCWGDNSIGQLGDGTNTGRSTPVAVDVSGLATQSFALVSAGAFHNCGVTTADEPFCWGRNIAGELGDGTTTGGSFSPVAVDVSGLSTQTFARVSAGTVHTCGVTTADEPYCWGNNGEGQLGDGTNTDRSTPVAVSTTEFFAEVSAGAVHTCGVTTAEETFCWGDNGEGRLGDGTSTNRSSPVWVDVSGLSTQTFARVSAALGSHTCGVTTADEPFCWGLNSHGQLGDGTNIDRSTPVAVDVSGPATQTFALVSAGAFHN